MATEVKSATDAQNVLEKEREAIIFIPGIGKGWDDPSIEGVARRLAIDIDRQSVSEKAKVHVEIAEQEYGIGYKCKMFTLIKSHDKKARSLIDVFGLDYNETLVETYAKRNLFTKTFLLALTLIEGFRRVIFRFYRKGKSGKEKLQLVYGLVIASLLIAYMVLLILAVVSSVEQLKKAYDASGQQNSPATQTVPAAPANEKKSSALQQSLMAQSDAGGPAGALWNLVKRGAAYVRAGVRSSWNFIIDKKELFPSIIVLISALGFIMPPKAKIKEKISLAATNYLCLIHYLNWGERNHAIGGKLEALLEHLVEKEDDYKKIHIIGYSFGSIVALDNLFPAGRLPIDRFSRIDTLVTIGCPFDMIRTYWPDYFMGRRALSPDKPKWINVYSPIDILSSNFADGGNDIPVDEAQEQDIGIEADGTLHKPESLIFSQGPHKALGWWDILTLAGFRAHSLYWGEEVKGEITCFQPIVNKMYRDTPVLN